MIKEWQEFNYFKDKVDTNIIKKKVELVPKYYNNVCLPIEINKKYTLKKSYFKYPFDNKK